MLKKALLMFLSLILLSFIASCKDNKNVQDDYINQIEREYQQSTNQDVILESNNFNSSPFYDDFSVNDYNQNNAPKKPTPTVRTSTPIRRGQRKATIYNFYSPWASTHKTDPLIIKEIRVMIANKEYTRARNYINNLDLNNLPVGVDLGQIYQFKGIVHYFLSKSNRANISIANESFKNVMNNTTIEKFKPLSLLWNGMLYQTYSTDMNELQSAVDLFDRVINEYPSTRFANDATFYKAVTLKKMGMAESEYNDLFLSVKRGGFADTLIFSQVVNDYVPANTLVDRELLR
ncbi:hypothetical protein EPJ70_11370 [Brachyspira aalborgi]|jgi:outer membrane protein assembly factor BamD (BamD/ComL family)|uniref:Tetratricopeptide repeat protein n=2 Tax=Brachyspira aalborgi TaxID=29522 RepID=A0A5C8ECD7_9SPIR|nr:hypothetical protein [Brachyspira aalborgi]MBS4764136.1 hypothetical protein [Brachyspira sp.]CCY76656.1 putative uncharacterized protein [Brachyspira sp. CAG:700]TXJ34332.1 hypothetical protein EPJ71_00235 [Brachyspira aalborgi]TXJ37543.1 hypothetical protein EPJ78_02160 [Brachyspira aalborgi]TXJ43354.1 hypothetical protein EPJ70_11370 [Brachyspira aalborgi]